MPAESALFRFAKILSTAFVDGASIGKKYKPLNVFALGILRIVKNCCRTSKELRLVAVVSFKGNNVADCGVFRPSGAYFIQLRKAARHNDQLFYSTNSAVSANFVPPFDVPFACLLGRQWKLNLNPLFKTPVGSASRRKTRCSRSNANKSKSEFTRQFIACRRISSDKI